MGEARQDGELGHRPRRTIQASVSLAPTKQTEELHHMLRVDGVGIRETSNVGAFKAATSLDQS
jgi:hypothetical protein